MQTHANLVLILSPAVMWIQAEGLWHPGCWVQVAGLWSHLEPVWDDVPQVALNYRRASVGAWTLAVLVMLIPGL